MESANEVAKHRELEKLVSGKAEYVGDLVDGSEEWHANRNNGIGASSIAVVMGMSPFKSAVQEWAERTGRYTAPEPSAEQQERFLLGHVLEESAAIRFAMLQPDLVVFNTGSWRSKVHTWQTCNPDRMLYDPDTKTFGVLEIKTSNHGYGWSGELPPLYYIAQVRDQLSVLGLDWGYLFAIIGNSAIKCYKIFRNANKPIFNILNGEMVYETSITEEAIIRCGYGFMDCVSKDTAPQVDGSVSAWQTVKKMIPGRNDGEEFIITENKAEKLKASKVLLDEAEAVNRELKAKIMQDMGEAQYVAYKDGNGNSIRVASRDKVRGGSFTLKIKN